MLQNNLVLVLNNTQKAVDSKKIFKHKTKNDKLMKKIVKISVWHGPDYTTNLNENWDVEAH